MFLSVEGGGKERGEEKKNHTRRLLDYTQVSFNRTGTETQTGPNGISGMFCESRRATGKKKLFLELMGGRLREFQASASRGG